MTAGAKPNSAVRFNGVDAFLWAIRITAIVVVVWGIVGSISHGVDGTGPTGAAWRDLIVAGVSQGSMYGLIALGYSMVYGVLGFINFAHGEVFMSGAMVGFFVARPLFEAGLWESNFILAILIVLVVAVSTSTLVAVIIERVAYRPLRGAPRLIPLITSIGISFFVQYTFAGLFGLTVKTYPQLPEGLREKISFLGIRIEGTKLLVIVVALISMAALYLFVERTKTGRAMRAVSEDKEIAALMGINVDRTIVTTFAVGGAMAGIAGMMWALLFRGISFTTGFLPGIKAFTAAVLGGIGNLVGAMAGGVLLGLFEGVGPQLVLNGLDWRLSLVLLEALAVAALLAVVVLRPSSAAAALWRRAAAVGGGVLVLTLAVPFLRDFGFSIDIPGISQLKDVVAFTALVLVLLFRPSGLFGERLASEDRA